MWKIIFSSQWYYAVPRILLYIILIAAVVFLVIPFILSTVGLVDQGSPLTSEKVGGNTLLRSSDGGVEWTSVARATEQKVSFPSKVLDVAFHPVDTNRLYLGAKSLGLWTSVDGGTSWKRIIDSTGFLGERNDVLNIVVASSSPDLLYVSVFQNKTGRVLKSTDGGNSFSEIFFADPERTLVSDMFVDPQNNEHILIVTEQGGVHESRNGGETWRVVKYFDDPLAQLVVNPELPDEFYVVTAKGEIHKTFTGGSTWTNLTGRVRRNAGVVRMPTFSEALSGSGQYDEIPLLSLDPTDARVLYLGSTSGLLRSTNGGFDWSEIKLPAVGEKGIIGDIAVHPDAGSTFFVGGGSRFSKTTDSGASWKAIALPTTAEIKKLLIHPLNPDILFVLLGK